MNIRNQQGFTIVELLIVIVVIAILATISIVAYNGIQSRAKSSAAQGLAVQIQQKAEAWNTIQAAYPSYCNFAFNETNAAGTATGVGTTGCTHNGSPASGPAEAKLDNPSKINAVAPGDANTVQYQVCNSAKGFRITWYDAISSSTKVINGGDTSAGTCGLS